MKRFLMLLAVLALLVSSAWAECMNGGVYMLARRKTPPQIIGYFCLCPFNYYGDTCAYSRDILCQFQNQKVTQYSPKSSPIASLQFDLQCFLIKLNHNNTKNSRRANNLLRLPLQPSQIEQELMDANYYIDRDYQIIWANDSSLFQSNGRLKRDANQTRTEEEILNSYPRYRFGYQGEFFGVPLYGMEVGYNLSAVMFRRGNLEIAEPKVAYAQVPGIATGVGAPAMKTVGTLTVEIKKDMEEYGVARPELTMLMFEKDGDRRIARRMGMNTAKWRIFNPDFLKGTLLQPNTSKIPSSFWVILAFLGLFALISGGRLAIKYYKRWRSKKQLKQISNDDRENAEQNAKDDD